MYALITGSVQTASSHKYLLPGSLCFFCSASILHILTPSLHAYFYHSYLPIFPTPFLSLSAAFFPTGNQFLLPLPSLIHYVPPTLSPGRLLDHLENTKLTNGKSFRQLCSKLQVLVLDEADQLMDQVYFYADDGDIILGIKDRRGGGGHRACSRRIDGNNDNSTTEKHEFKIPP